MTESNKNHILSVEMKINAQIISFLQKKGASQKGIFTTSDLHILFKTSTREDLYQKIKPFLLSSILTPFCRGYYVLENFSLEQLSQRICPHSVVSFGNVLAKELVIGSVPKMTVYATKMGPSRIYASPNQGTIVHLGFQSSGSQNLVNLGTTWKDGVQYTDKEKAFLDTLYFYQSGQTFSINIYSDINVSILDSKKVEKYLENYRNPKFKIFVRGILYGQNT